MRSSSADHGGTASDRSLPKSHARLSHFDVTRLSDEVLRDLQLDDDLQVSDSESSQRAKKPQRARPKVRVNSARSARAAPAATEEPAKKAQKSRGQRQITAAAAFAGVKPVNKSVAVQEKCGNSEMPRKNSRYLKKASEAATKPAKVAVPKTEEVHAPCSCGDALWDYESFGVGSDNSSDDEQLARERRRKVRDIIQVG
jgi:hypothetical protein